MDIVRVFGTNLRRHRTEKGYSQENLLNCSAYTVLISAISNASQGIFPSRMFRK